MDWFDKIKINDDITITMLPAQHWSKRWIWGEGIQIEVFGVVF